MGAVTQRKRGGPAALLAKLLMPGCSTDDVTCHTAASDLKTWGSKFWPSDGARYSWTGGTPDAVSGPGARSGVFSTLGTFQLHIPTNGTAARSPVRKLSLFTGLFNYGKTAISKENWANSATLRISSPGQPGINHTVTHMDGNNNDAINTAFDIIFTGELTLTWGLDQASEACTSCGWVSMQAARLETYDGEVGGVALVAAHLREDIRQ